MLAGQEVVLPEKFLDKFRLRNACAFPKYGVLYLAAGKVELRGGVDSCAHACFGGHALPVITPVVASTPRSMPLKILRMRAIVVSVTK